MESLKKRIIVTGGGSGGHVSASQSIISAIRERYVISDDTFLYVGGDLGMVGEKTGKSFEKSQFAKEDFQQKYIRAGKLQRSLSLGSLKLFLRTFLGIIDAYKIIKSFKPDIVISTGGFVAVPVCLMSKLFKADIYLHEQTAAVGLSNKLISKLSKKIFITFPSSTKFFDKEKVIHTGNLIRKQIFSETGKGKIVDSLKKMIEKQENLPIIYVSGGGLGSHVLNQTIRDSLPNILRDFQVILQTGDNQVFKDYDLLLQTSKSLPDNLQDKILVTKYISSEEIGFLFHNIDMYVGRAGANTVYEMGVMQIPSIFIPIPWVTHNEQEKNAQILVNLGIAKIIKEGELTPEKLHFEIETFLKKPKSVDEKQLKEIFSTDAAEKILKSIGL